MFLNKYINYGNASITDCTAGMFEEEKDIFLSCPIYERKLGGIRGLGFLRESLSHCCNLSILL